MKSNIISGYESDDNILEVWFTELINGKEYYTIRFNGKIVHSVRSKHWHEVALNQLIRKYDLKKVE